MKKSIGFVAAALLAAPGTAAAQSGSGQSTLFECTLRNGRTVRVTEQGGNFFYNYGTRRRPELSLRGSARAGNVFHLFGRYYAISTQIRFTRGAYSYIVHSLPGSARHDARGTSGVIVVRGDRVISDQQCRRVTEMSGWELLRTLPEDDERWLAMSLGN